MRAVSREDGAVLLGQLDAVRVQNVRTEEADAIQERHGALAEPTLALLTVENDLVGMQAHAQAALVRQPTRGAQALLLHRPCGAGREPHLLWTIRIDEPHTVSKLGFDRRQVELHGFGLSVAQAAPQHALNSDVR